MIRSTHWEQFTKQTFKDQMTLLSHFAWVTTLPWGRKQNGGPHGFLDLYFYSRTEINDIKKKTDLWFPLIISWNELIKDPGILTLVIFFINSHKLSLDYVLIMLRENWCWSLLGVKGLNPKSTFHDGALTQSFNSWSLESPTTQLFMELWGGYVRVIFDKRRGIETTTYR